MIESNVTQFTAEKDNEHLQCKHLTHALVLYKKYMRMHNSST